MSYNFVPASLYDAVYGDGSRGDATITGTETLSEDRFYNNLTITSTGVVVPSNYKIFVKGKLEIQTGGIIRANGNNASGATQGASVNISGTVRGFGRRGSSGLVATGANQAGPAASFAVANQPPLPGATSTAGFSGGAGGGATLAGGAGNAGTSLALLGTVKNFYQMLRTGYLPDRSASMGNEISGGAGGGGGAVDAGAGTDFSGGGGGGGAVIVIFAKEIVNNGSIQAKGGTGGNASHATAKAGGGGGGAGGAIFLITRFPTKTGTLDVSGGAGGSGAGGGVTGTTGDTGLTSIMYC